MGQHYHKQCIVFLLLLLYFCTGLSGVSAAEDANVSIRMLQGEQQTRFDSSVLVTGIWHYVNITTDQNYDDLSFWLYKGIILPTWGKNETNYYEWSYHKDATIVWSDTSGYGIKYIQPGLCQRTNTQYTFCIGLKDFMPNIVDYHGERIGEVSNKLLHICHTAF